MRSDKAGLCLRVTTKSWTCPDPPDGLRPVELRTPRYEHQSGPENSPSHRWRLAVQHLRLVVDQGIKGDSVARQCLGSRERTSYQGASKEIEQLDESRIRTTALRPNHAGFELNGQVIQRLALQRSFQVENIDLAMIRSVDSRTGVGRQESVDRGSPAAPT